MRDYPPPAYVEMVEDEGFTDTAIKVYIRIWRMGGLEPTSVKETVLARALGTTRETVRNAIRWLIARGYVIDHGRGLFNVRKLQIVLLRQLADNPPQSSAA